jgi:integrase
MTKNKHYRDLLDNGEFKEIITEEKLEMALKEVKGINGKYVDEGRAMLILLYYTGARPSEILELTPKMIERDYHDMVINFSTKKHGRARRIYLDLKKPLIVETYKFCKKWVDSMYIFYHYKSKYIRKLKNGKTRKETTRNIRYYVYKWFSEVIKDGIPPYYLRHNRFTKLALKGATDRQLKQMKGSSTDDSLRYYIHSSADEGKKLKKIND